MDESPALPADRPSSAPMIISTSENIERTQRPSTGSSMTSSIHTPHSSSQSKDLPKIGKSNNISTQNKQKQSTKIDRTSTQKDSSTDQSTSRSSFEQKPYYHDVLVIHTQPPKVNTDSH